MKTRNRFVDVDAASDLRARGRVDSLRDPVCGPHVVLREQRVAALQEHYARLGGWKGIGRDPHNKPDGMAGTRGRRRRRRHA